VKPSRFFSRERWLIGLDIGSSKICAAIGRQPIGGSTEIVGVGMVLADGVEAGAVIDSELVVEGIRRAVEEAQRRSGARCRGMIVGGSGPWLRLVPAVGRVRIADQAREIARHDVERSVAAATTIHLPMDRDVLHALIRRFAVDEHSDVRMPIGMYGRRLGVEVSLVTAPITTLANLAKAVQLAGFSAERIVWSRLAAAEAITSLAQRQAGVMVMEFGMEISSILMYRHGRVVGASLYPQGSTQLRNAISRALKLERDLADEVIRQWGVRVRADRRSSGQVLVGVGASQQTLVQEELAEIVDRSLDRWLEMVEKAVTQTDPEFRSHYPHGVVVTGGVSALDGLAERVASHLGVEAACGTVSVGSGRMLKAEESGRVAAAIGLVHQGLTASDRLGLQELDGQRGLAKRLLNSLSRLYEDYF